MKSVPAGINRDAVEIERKQAKRHRLSFGFMGEEFVFVPRGLRIMHKIKIGSR